ncbi:MAG: SUMF1/EgtB/PvdO family nonheme iron enzyme [Phycisphaerae bacterium]|nr:SUMF1/EgtB/PvdO family nonheme iron enzyme [Phycisphaerae bacterium]
MSDNDEKSIFTEAIALAPSQREALLAERCADEGARERIRALLRHHDALATRVAGVAPEVPTTEPLEPGQRIGRYTLLRQLGRGGMGVVFLAHDHELDRQVALKVIADSMPGVTTMIDRFRQEARMAAALRHPSVVRVYEASQDGNRHFIVSEFVDGTTLAEQFGELQSLGGQGDAKACRRRLVGWIASIADALEGCRRAGIIHRDVKPSNILIDSEHGARLSDFGIAVRTGASRDGTSLPDAGGTMHYMSPEQATRAQQPIDHRSDIFSLGVVLYEGLAHRRPFDGADPLVVLRALIHEVPPPLRRIVRGIDRDLETISIKALEKHPDNRYPTAGHLAADLRAWLDGTPVLASRPGRVRRMRQWIRAHRGTARATVGLAATAALAATAWQGRSLYESRFLRVAITAPNGTLAWLHSADPTSGEFEAERPATPISLERSLRLEPGQYRLTVVAAEGEAFSEFNLVVTEADCGEHLNVVAIAPTERLALVRGDGADRLLGSRLWKSEAAAGMIEVPGGSYAIGSKDESGALHEPQSVDLQAFLIDQREVSNASYQAFLDETGSPPPRFWKDRRENGSLTFTPGLDHYPITGISLEEAEAYARWVGKRLPTRGEWEAATRGPDGQRLRPRHPEGIAPPQEPTIDMLRAREGATAEDLAAEFARFMVPVDALDPYALPNGLAHAFGNVREITGTVLLESRAVVIKGRCAWDFPQSTDFSRIGLAPLGSCAVDHGFRCARSVHTPLSRLASFGKGTS